MGLLSLSVILPNYNHARFLPEALEALAAQSCQPLEIIVIDDASTDDSIQIIQEYQRKCAAIRLEVNAENRGVVYSINRGLELSQADYVYSGAADDRALPGLFEESLELLARHPGAGLCSSMSLQISEDGGDRGLFPSPRVIEEPGFLSPERAREMLLAVKFWVMGNTTVYRRKALVETGGFRSELGSFADGFAQRVLALRHGVCFLPEPLAVWRRMDDCYSSREIADMKRAGEIMARAEKLMREDYGDIFPPEYARAWKREWQSWTIQYAWERAREPLRRYAEGVRVVCPSESLLDPLFSFGVRTMLKALSLLVRLFLFARFNFSWRRLFGQRRGEP